MSAPRSMSGRVKSKFGFATCAATLPRCRCFDHDEYIYNIDGVHIDGAAATRPGCCLLG